MAGYDYTVTNGKILLSDNISVLDDALVIVTWMSAATYISATTFRLFKDLNDNFYYNRAALADAAFLTK